MLHFFKDRLKSLIFVFKGLFLLIRTENAIKAQIAIFSLFLLLGFYFEISREDWIIQIFCMGLILTAEGLNTAVEKLCDFVHPDYHKKIGFIKDISSGAVGFAALASIIIVGMIYAKYCSFL